MRESRTDRLLELACWCSAFMVLAIAGWILFDVMGHGFRRVDLNFLLGSPIDAGRQGGIAPILVSTVLILGVCMTVAVPIGVGAAVALSEYGSEGRRATRLIRASLDVLAGIPSIVFGLFGNALFCRALGMGFSIASGGLTLACMALPLVIRSTEEGLRSVPVEYRHAAAALGMSRTSTLVHLLLPAATPGLLVGLVLGIGRALAETAALLFTSGYVSRWPTSIFDSGRTLSVHIYDLSMNVPGGDGNSHASALVLVALLIGINLTASLMANVWLRRRIRT